MIQVPVSWDSRTRLPSRRSFSSLMGVAICSCKHIGRREAEHDGLRSKLRNLLNVADYWGTVLVSQGDEVLFSAARGYSNPKRVIRLDDRFVIGSISKQVTAAIVLRELERQSLSLTRSIADFLSDIHQPWVRTVTIHHLLSHTHGIQDVDRPLRFEPGARFEYSQLGYELLAQIVETINAKPFVQICQELFAELELWNTFHPEEQDRAQLVRGFERQGSMEFHQADDSLRNYAAAGSLISTASDLARWNLLLHSGGVVRMSSLQRMSKRYATRQHPIFGAVEYGYGLLFGKKEQQLQIGALGYAPGFASASYFYPKRNMNLVLLSNRVDLSKGFAHAFRAHTKAMELVKAESSKELGN